MSAWARPRTILDKLLAVRIVRDAPARCRCPTAPPSSRPGPAPASASRICSRCAGGRRCSARRLDIDRMPAGTLSWPASRAALRTTCSPPCAAGRRRPGARPGLPHRARSTARRGRPARRPRHGRRCGAARARAARSGCPCGRSCAPPARPAAAGRPCRPSAAPAARRAARRPAPPRRPRRARCRAPSRATRTPVMPPTTSFRLSRCCTLSVVNDVDAGVEQFLDVLPALGVARAGRVGVRQLVDQDQRRLARQRGVEVELARASGPGSRWLCGGSSGRPSSSAAVSLRPWVSTTPTSTSRPSACSSRRGAPASRRSCRRRPTRRSRCAACRARRGAPAAAPARAARRGRDAGIGSRTWPVSSRQVDAAQRRWSSARLSASTLTRGSPRKPSSGRFGVLARPALRTCVQPAACARGRRAPPGSGRRPG